MPNEIVLPLLFSFLITIIITPLSLIFIKKLTLIDDPKTHKHPAILHTNPIPRGGGIPLFLGIFLAGIFFLPLTKVTIFLFFASFLALTVGSLDDKYDIVPYLRFGINVLCALIVVGGGVGIPFITSPFGGIIHLDTYKWSFYFFGNHTILFVSDAIAIIWTIWVMNMLNWSKGVDGQMPGIVAISAFVIGLLSLRFTPHDQLTLISSNISFLITGASLGFLVYNFYPAKILPGYGATSIYLLLAAVSILSGAKLATAILVMGVPMIDGIFTVLRRILSGRSPFWGDKKHLHHLLLQLGFNQQAVALFYWIISAILGAIALTLTSSQKIFAIVMLVVVAGAGLLFLHLTINRKNEKNTL